MKKALVALAAGAAVVASTPSRAEPGDDVVRIAPGFEDVYSDSKKKESKAQKEIARADAETDASDALRLEGERLMADSDAEIAAHVAAYRAFRDRIGNALSAADARAEAQALSDIARTWAVSEANREKGAKMISQSEADAARAASRRGAAEQKLAEARDAIARSTIAAPIAQAAPAPATETAAPAEAITPEPAALTLQPVAEETLAPPPVVGPAAAPAQAPAAKSAETELLGGPE